MHADEDRERLRQTFDAAAARYDRVRPEYPGALFDDLVALAGLKSGDHLLEVGCATGKATRPLARRGYRITCVELGAELAAVARQNLTGLEVEVVRAAFEQWRAPHPFGLVYAATAWHWIDPAVRYQRAWQALRPGGHLALWAAEHVFPDGGDPFFDDIDDRTSAVVPLLRNIDESIEYIRKMRDDLHVRFLVWDDLLKAWEPNLVEYSMQVGELLRKTHQFLAPRFMSFTDWTAIAREEQKKRARLRIQPMAW